MRGNYYVVVVVLSLTGIVLLCPDDVEVASDQGRNYSSYVTWDKPIIIATGGEDYEATITQSPHTTAGTVHYIGTTRVNYDARDYEDNIITSCNFTITVLGK